jgi:hypothetical protein
MTSGERGKDRFEKLPKPEDQIGDYRRQISNCPWQGQELSWRGVSAQESIHLDTEGKARVFARFLAIFVDTEEE